MGTRDGFVEVTSEQIERYEGWAEPVVIDGPTPPGLRRRVLAREARRCGNPRCHHRADPCHPIVFRARSGKTELANEVAVCRTCHARIHAGLLRVLGDANGELQWLPGAASAGLGREVASAGPVADRLPVLRLVPDSTRPPGPGSAVPRESADADSEPTPESADADSERAPGSGDGGAGIAARALDLEALAHGLARLGVPLGRSRRIVRASLDALPPAEITEAAVLRRALASIGSVRPDPLATPSACVRGSSPAS